MDTFGNVLKSVAIGYGRRIDSPDAALQSEDREKQRLIHITGIENDVTNAIDNQADAYRTPMPAQSCTYELRKPQQEKSGNGSLQLYRFEDVLSRVNQSGDGAHYIYYEDIDFIKATQAVANDADETNNYFRRIIEQVRTYYRPNEFGAAQNDPLRLLPFKSVESMALPGESYKLAFTPGLLDQVYIRSGQKLLPANPADVLEGGGADHGGYVDLKGDGHWWIPSGRSFFSTNRSDSAATELAQARQHFFLPRRYRDPFGQDAFVDFDTNDLLMAETRDVLGNRVTVDVNDYRILQPRLVSDPNRNQTEVAFDVLGMVVGTAIMGKATETVGDALDASFQSDLTQAELDAFMAKPREASSNPEESVSTQIVHDLLGKATTRIVYDLDRFRRIGEPAFAATFARETHVSELQQNPKSKLQISFAYSDGFGREIQQKIQAEPGVIVAGDPAISARWVGSGWIIFNNKGKPVRRYEPFFSATHEFEFGVQVGVSPILFYDPVERVVATLHPNNTYEKVVFDPWQQTTWDVNDTVLDDPRTDDDIKGYTASYFAVQPVAWQTWHAQRQGGERGVPEQSAASKAVSHADTPTMAHFDTLGRPFLTLAHNGFNQDATPIRFATRVELDIEGNQREVRDAIEQAGDQQGRIVMRNAYDMLGNRIHQLSMEAGARWMLGDVAGKPIRDWDSRSHTFRTEYDPLRRPLRSLVTGADPANPDQELLTERLVYGEQHPEAELRNLRGKLYLHLDQAGAVASEAHDFKGNPLRASRRIATEYKQALNWSTVDAALPGNATAQLDPYSLEAALVPLLEADTYTSRTTYDALNRPTTLIAPHTPMMQPSVILPGYNEANLLERVDVNLRGATANGQPVWTPFVSNIDYDAKGQRQRIDYGSGARTFYTYDPLTFRLVHLLTRRNAVAFPDDCPQPPPVDWPGCQVQNLHYTYDPVGNITHIRDDAQQTIYFRNRRVEPSAEYRYDAIYRLIEATGREHLGQISGAPIPHSHNDAQRVGINWAANDGNAMGTYTERYVYDTVGNFLEMQHRGSDPVHPGWTRRYAYGETSLTEDGAGSTPLKTSNRLSSTTVGNNNPLVKRYVYDAHGNMVRMPHLGSGLPGPNMHWDYKDQLRQTDLGGGGFAYYVYDASGQRVRKVWEKSANLIEERIYLGGFEVYRRRQGTEWLERETLHIMDDKQRIALVETRTLDSAGNDPAPQQFIRYQIGNHLGSVSLELDEQARIISCEEYTPYGSTSYQAVRSQTEVAKRYRYTGKERDEETGLNYHGARYYAPWLGRWVSSDRIGLVDGTNLYKYASDSPIRSHDPTGNEPEPFQLSPPSFLSPRSSEDRRPARFTGSLVPPLQPSAALNLLLPGVWTPPFSRTSAPNESPSGSSESPTPKVSPNGEAETDTGPKFSGGLLSLRLQMDWGHVRALADTKSTGVSLKLGDGSLTAAYAYAGDLSLISRGPAGAGTVSVNPGSGLTTLRVEGNFPSATVHASVNTAGDLGVGVKGKGVKVDASYNPGSQNINFSLSIGRQPAPITSTLYEIVPRGVAGGTRLVAQGLGSVYKLQTPDTIRDISAVTRVVTAGLAIADVPRVPASTDLSVRVNLTYRPDRGLTASAVFQLMHD